MLSIASKQHLWLRMRMGRRAPHGPVGTLVDEVLKRVLERVRERLGALERLVEHRVQAGLHVQQRRHHLLVLPRAARASRAFLAHPLPDPQFKHPA